MRVFFDASVLIAALLSPQGGSSSLLQYARLGGIFGITSQTVIDEILEEDKPGKLKKTREEIEIFIAESGLLIQERITLEEIVEYEGKIDAEDAHVVAGANLTKCSYLVTLDKKHLLRDDIKAQCLPLMIVSPKELLEELLRQ